MKSYQCAKCDEQILNLDLLRKKTIQAKEWVRFPFYYRLEFYEQAICDCGNETFRETENGKTIVVNVVRKLKPTDNVVVSVNVFQKEDK